MKPNIGSIDRTVRLVAGVAILATGFFLNSWWGLAGLLPILTATVRFCPAYLPLGINTCAGKPDQKN